ncbi:MAG: hypothetical protein H6908_00110 [Hyphomicrobiales bacterium]|nr:hypothetical protein [Hyphomicrobiales bacterium]
MNTGKVPILRRNIRYIETQPFPYQKAYYVLNVALGKEKRFDALLKKKDATIHLPDYGDIVASGWGEPSEELKQHLRDTYGANV